VAPYDTCGAADARLRGTRIDCMKQLTKNQELVKHTSDHGKSAECTRDAAVDRSSAFVSFAGAESRKQRVPN
jgi:hypothetical protein